MQLKVHMTIISVRGLILRLKAKYNPIHKVACHQSVLEHTRMRVLKLIHVFLHSARMQNPVQQRRVRANQMATSLMVHFELINTVDT